MSWQKVSRTSLLLWLLLTSPRMQPLLSSPLLMLNKSLHKDALKLFKVIQHVMGDRERDRPVGSRAGADTHAPHNASTPSLVSGSSAALLEEERWLLSEGLAHGELRDEIYCQVMKQLTGNPNTCVAICC